MVNDRTWALVTHWEGLVLLASPDPVGILTVAYGHTNAAGAPFVFPGMTVTEEQANSILQNDLHNVELDIQRVLKVPVNMNQWGALVSFTFNLGIGALAGSTLLRRLNGGDYGIENEFGRWVYAQDGDKLVKLPGLVSRRADEANLWQTGV